MKVNLQINNAYLPYLFSYKNRIEVFYGGAGSGKSIFVAQKLVLKALNTKTKRKILVIRKVARTQKESCFAVICKILSSLNYLNACTINKTTLDITLPNGSIILFKGMDDPEKIKSIADITDIWCEEATELTLDDFSQLNLRLRALNPNLQIWLSFNPVSKANWCYQYFFARETNTFILHITYRDNSFLPKEYIEEIESYKTTNPTYYKIYVEGEFATLDKLVYNNYEILDFDIDELIKSKEYITLTGLDFGFTNDPTALIVSLVNQDKRELYIIDEYGDTGLTNPDIANVIKSLGYQKNIIMCDSADPKSIEELRRQGIPRVKPCKKSPDSILHGIQQLQQYRIYVLPKCEKTITELQNYSWQKDKQTNEYINKPIDKFNHYLDALRYSMQIIKGRIGTIKGGLL